VETARALTLGADLLEVVEVPAAAEGVSDLKRKKKKKKGPDGEDIFEDELDEEFEGASCPQKSSGKESKCPVKIAAKVVAKAASTVVSAVGETLGIQLLGAASREEEAEKELSVNCMLLQHSEATGLPSAFATALEEIERPTQDMLLGLLDSFQVMGRSLGISVKAAQKCDPDPDQLQELARLTLTFRKFVSRRDVNFGSCPLSKEPRLFVGDVDVLSVVQELLEAWKTHDPTKMGRALATFLYKVGTEPPERDRHAKAALEPVDWTFRKAMFKKKPQTTTPAPVEV